MVYYHTRIHGAMAHPCGPTKKKMAAHGSEARFIWIEDKRGIHIVRFLHYIQEKAWEGRGNYEEATITIRTATK